MRQNTSIVRDGGNKASHSAGRTTQFYIRGDPNYLSVPSVVYIIYTQNIGCHCRDNLWSSSDYGAPLQQIGQGCGRRQGFHGAGKHPKSLTTIRDLCSLDTLFYLYE